MTNHIKNEGRISDPRSFRSDEGKYLNSPEYFFEFLSQEPTKHLERCFTEINSFANIELWFDMCWLETCLEALSGIGEILSLKIRIEQFYQ